MWLRPGTRNNNNRRPARGHSGPFPARRKFGARALRCKSKPAPARTLLLVTLAGFTLREFEIGRQLLSPVEKAGEPTARLDRDKSSPEAFGLRKLEKRRRKWISTKSLPSRSSSGLGGCNALAPAVGGNRGSPKAGPQEAVCAILTSNNQGYSSPY